MNIKFLVVDCLNQPCFEVAISDIYVSSIAPKLKDVQRYVYDAKTAEYVPSRVETCMDIEDFLKLGKNLVL